MAEYEHLLCSMKANMTPNELNFLGNDIELKRRDPLDEIN